MDRLLVIVLAAMLAACSAPAPVSPSASLAPASAATSASASAVPSAGEGVVVTFRVADRETYRVLLVDPDDIAAARAWQEGSARPLIPNGLIVRGGDGGVNTGYSWHIDPADIEFAELAIEVCDGLPSFVEDGTLSGDRYCPWSAEIVSIEPASQ